MPRNQIPVFVNSLPAQGLVDTGAACSIISGKLYRRILNSMKNGASQLVSRSENRNLLTADTSPMKVTASVDTEIKINGLLIPYTFVVIETIAYDLILGMDFLNDTSAVIDVQSNTLSLFNGLTAVTMSRSGKTIPVCTIANVEIPPFSEAILPIQVSQSKLKGNFMVEKSLAYPHRALLVARTLIDPSKRKIQCRVLNPTDTTIRLKAGTPIGSVTSVTVEQQDMSHQSTHRSEDINLPTVTEMINILESTGISFTDTAVKDKELDELITLLYRNRDLIATSLMDLPGTDVLLHRIDTGDSPPIRKRSFRHSPADMAEISRQTNEMLQAGIIEESDTPWSSPVLLVSKKDGTKRFVIDYRAVNAVTKLTSWPLPTIEDIFDRISTEHPVLWSSLDLRSGYWQTRLDPDTADRTGFQTHDGNFVFKRTPFGLCGAVQFFQQTMHKVMKGLSPSSILIYLDDCLIMGKNHGDMLDKLQKVFDKLRSAKLRIHPSKCHWSVNKVKFLGHIFDEKGIAVDDSKISIVRDFKVPTTPKKVKSWLGLCNYYRRFVKGFSQITAPLRELLKKDTRFRWNEQCQESFDKLKNALISAPILALPDFSKPFVLTTDASTTGIAYILGQRDEGGREHVICYGGRGLKPNEKKWSITDLEGLALVQGVQQYHTYLADKPFEVVSDHISLTYIQNMKLSGNNRLTRWALFLQPYKFTISYKKGELLTSADTLSRIEREENSIVNSPPDVTNNSLPHEELQADDDTFIFNCNATERTYIDFCYGDDVESINTVMAPSFTPRQLPMLEDIKSALPTCADLGDMYHYLTDGTLPTCDKQARRVILESSDFAIENGVLYHMYTPRTKHLHRAQAVVKQLCIPTPFREDIAIGLHDRNAHPGFDRLYATARTRYFWPGMYVFLKNHVITCMHCQQAKRPIHPGKTPIVSLPVPAPCTRWHIDFHGPFPDSNGMKYILLLIDSTSMWPELIATEDCTADTVVRVLFDHVIARFGLPRGISILTDNGSAFISKLSKQFCKMFGIQQFFTSPHHPQTNSRAEEFADTIHKSLRILCDKQSDWSTHLQAIAMAYRASATTNLGISPHEVLFGKPMTLAIDWGLIGSDEMISSAQAYSASIKPKLEILHQIAIENAMDSAERHAQAHNSDSSPPTFKAGDKILLFNPVTKKNECAKLKRRYLGPYIITDCKPGFNYMLKELATGKEIKRPVHANRLRALRELDNDYRMQGSYVDVRLFEGKTEHRGIDVTVRVGNIIDSNCDVIVNPANCLLKHEDGAAKTIARAAGKSLVDACNDYITTHQQLDIATPLVTTAGSLQPQIKAVMHVVGPNVNEQQFANNPLLVERKLHEAFYNCFTVADKSGNFESLACPAISSGIFGMEKWTVAHEAAKALKQFDIDTLQDPGSIRKIEFVVLSMDFADIISTVFRQTILPALTTNQLVSPTNDLLTSQVDTNADNLGNPAVPTTGKNDEWLAIEEILRHQKRRSKDFYLVKWKDTAVPSWVERKDVSEGALQHFYANRKKRKRRRRY